MKRVDALRSLMAGGIQRVDLKADLDGELISIDAVMAMRLYDYLHEDLPDPKKDRKSGASLMQDQCKLRKNELKERKKIDMGKLVALAKAGRTREWIAEDMGISVATVYNYLKKAKEEGLL